MQTLNERCGVVVRSLKITVLFPTLTLWFLQQRWFVIGEACARIRPSFHGNPRSCGFAQCQHCHALDSGLTISDLVDILLSRPNLLAQICENGFHDVKFCEER